MPLFKQECPICEFVFEIDEADIEESQSIRCACCDHMFSANRIAQMADSDLSSTQILTHSGRKPKADADPSVAIGKSDNLRSSILVKRMQAKRRSNVILMLLVLSAIASIGYLFYRFNDLERERQQRIADSDFQTTEATDSSDQVVLEGDSETQIPSTPRPASDSVVAEPPKPAPVISVPVETVPPPEYRFLSAANAADQAALTRPYLVLLEVESPAGITFATGTIVDSRGYIATSLRAVAGATSIKVSPALKTSQIKRNVAPPLSDNVRSILTISRSQQFVLLEINRRLVLNANDIKIPTADRVVSRLPLLRVIAPQSPLDYVVSEMRVESRRRSKDLTAKEKQLLNTSISKQNDDVNWIRGLSSPYDRLGAVLISPDGKLMAMLVNSDDQFSYFVSASEIARRLQEKKFEKQSLSVLSRVQ